MGMGGMLLALQRESSSGIKSLESLIWQAEDGTKRLNTQRGSDIEIHTKFLVLGIKEVVELID